MRPRSCILIISACAVTMLVAQQPSDRDAALALDKQVSKLGELSTGSRTHAIKALSARILKQGKYAVMLASNLAIDGTGDSDHEGLQVITTTLAKALSSLPLNDEDHQNVFEQLAELVCYTHTTAPLEKDHRYRAAVAKLQEMDNRRSETDFTLSDTQGNKWNLKSLRGKVIFLNFWATWCPPCRAELPDLNALYQRFERQGLIILAISDEDVATLNRFLSQNKITYPVLLDPGGLTKKQFLVPGFPESYVYDRAGHLVAQSIYQPSLEGLFEMVEQAGLK